MQVVFYFTVTPPHTNTNINNSSLAFQSLSRCFLIVLLVYSKNTKKEKFAINNHQKFFVFFLFSILL
jgi:hypothetical protein